jgi:hypothetical protein
MFLLQIVYPDGAVVRLPAGGKLELQLIDELTAAIVDRGVGFLKTEAHVEADIRDGLKSGLLAFKKQIVRVV